MVDHRAKVQATLIGLSDYKEVDEGQIDSEEDHLDALVRVGDQEEDKVEDGDYVLGEFKVRLGRNE